MKLRFLALLMTSSALAAPPTPPTEPARPPSVPAQKIESARQAFYATQEQVPDTFAPGRKPWQGKGTDGQPCVLEAALHGGASPIAPEFTITLWQRKGAKFTEFSFTVSALDATLDLADPGATRVLSGAEEPARLQLEVERLITAQKAGPKESLEVLKLADGSRKVTVSRPSATPDKPAEQLSCSFPRL